MVAILSDSEGKNNILSLANVFIHKPLGLSDRRPRKFGMGAIEVEKYSLGNNYN